MNAVLKPQVLFGTETVNDVLEEIRPLLVAHKDEVAHYHDLELKPDYGKYYAAQQHGLLRIYTARIDGSLIGYVIYLLGFSLHYSDSLQALADVLYLDQRYRRGRLGRNLILYSEDQLRADAVQVVRQHHKLKSALSAFFESLGYESEDMIHVKRLDR